MIDVAELPEVPEDLYQVSRQSTFFQSDKAEPLELFFIRLCS